MKNVFELGKKNHVWTQKIQRSKERRDESSDQDDKINLTPKYLLIKDCQLNVSVLLLLSRMISVMQILLRDTTECSNMISRRSSESSVMKHSKKTQE